jgi:outer membrane receptor protein involved in Fe transport
VRNDSVAWDLYANFGRGFHSNDARGTVITPTPALTAQCADPMHVPAGTSCAVTPMTPATGYELGTRLRLLRRIDLSAAAWLLDLDQETVWNGDSGTTEASGPTRRLGLTFEARAEILQWLWADLDVSLVNAVYRENAGNADAVALAPPWVIAAGIAARHPSGFFGSVRLRAIGDRPADAARTLYAQGFAIVNARLGYRRDWFEFALEAENLLNSQWREAQFESDSRLPNEPLDCPSSVPRCHTDIHFTPGTPFAASARITLYLH